MPPGSRPRLQTSSRSPGQSQNGKHGGTPGGSWGSSSPNPGGGEGGLVSLGPGGGEGGLVSLGPGGGPSTAPVEMNSWQAQSCP
jgi:hypothetical protein